MTPDSVRTAADARKIVEERKLDHVKVGVFDNDGVMRGKYMGRDKFFAALDKGFGFCDVVLGWDSNDQLYDNVKYTGWHTAYPDAPVRILPDTCRPVPFEGDMVMFLGEFAEKAEAVCPRAALRRVLRKADDMGYSAVAATEFEFFMFRETPESVREKGFRNLTTLTPGYFGYSVLRSSVHAEFYHQLMKLCTDMRMPLEGLHTETGPGVLEAAIQYCEALEAADRGALFKTFTALPQECIHARVLVVLREAAAVNHQERIFGRRIHLAATPRGAGDVESRLWAHSLQRERIARAREVGFRRVFVEERHQTIGRHGIGLQPVFGEALQLVRVGEARIGEQEVRVVTEAVPVARGQLLPEAYRLRHASGRLRDQVGARPVPIGRAVRGGQLGSRRLGLRRLLGRLSLLGRLGLLGLSRCLGRGGKRRAGSGDEKD